jgi:hypothetical protein
MGFCGSSVILPPLNFRGGTYGDRGRSESPHTIDIARMGADANPPLSLYI